MTIFVSDVRKCTKHRFKYLKQYEKRFSNFRSYQTGGKQTA